MPMLPSFLILLSVIDAVSPKKDGSLSELLSAEESRLAKLGAECPLQKLQRKTVDSLRLKEEHSDKTLACIVRFLKDNPSDGPFLTALGTVFEHKGKKFASQANTVFKQAVKISGKFPSYIKDWHVIGPFVIGKTEFDGDPLEAVGGIHNVSRFRLESGVSYPSELLPHGKVQWIHTKQTAADQAVRVAPKVNWNDLVSSLGSLGITEWQGWAVGELLINQDDVTLLVQCLGVSTVFIDGVPLTGDVYHRERFWFAAGLARGVHLVTVKLRTKVQALFQCSFKAPPKEGFEVLEPQFQPDLYDGFLFSTYLSVPVTNYKSDKWLRITKIAVKDQSLGESLTAELFHNKFQVAPGQTRPIIVKLGSQNNQISTHCKDVDFSLVVKTSEGQSTLPLTLRCRKKRESFLFTFLDHDGSVQHGAAIEPIRSCLGGVCPVLLTLHGTTVPPQNQADSYKRMVDGDFKFGVKGMWVLAPTRHGAHNWEGPGALTAMASLEALADLTRQHQWISNKADSAHVLFEGHSMGGHGAWHLATHYPDRAVGLAALAGWIKKEEYGDSNLFFRHDVATSHTDPAVKAVMEACIAENDADRHVSNLWKIPVLCRIGGNDRTVHPFFSRRMYRLLEEENIDVTYTELEGLEHWWWDTWETNDGGAVNDKQMRGFAEKCLSALANGGSRSVDEESCTSDGCGDSGESGAQMWQAPKHTVTGVTELVTVNPAFGEGLRGVRILQQTVPLRTSKIKINVTADKVYLTTSNVQRFTISEPPNRPVQWLDKVVTVDGLFQVRKEDLELVLSSDPAHFCKTEGSWRLCAEDVHRENRRGPLTLGPARRIAENSFLIITGTRGTSEMTRNIQAYAVYIANLFLLTSDAYSPVVKDVDVTPEQIDGAVHLGECVFKDPSTGILTLAPNGPHNLAMIVMGNSIHGLANVISLATPTIPPMTRSP
ncbi:hypothetical protein BaRGS_00015319, partial [Batillaria attramentaria]